LQINGKTTCAKGAESDFFMRQSEKDHKIIISRLDHQSEVVESEIRKIKAIINQPNANQLKVMQNFKFSTA